LSQYFTPCVDFIHGARLGGGAVLVHCLAGVSRSVTVTVAYVMSVTSLGWVEALNAVRGARDCASPNYGFQRQLLNFEHEGGLEKMRAHLRADFPALPAPYHEDEAHCRRMLAAYAQSGNDVKTPVRPPYTVTINGKQFDINDIKEAAADASGENSESSAPAHTES